MKPSVVTLAVVAMLASVLLFACTLSWRHRPTSRGGRRGSRGNRRVNLAANVVSGQIATTPDGLPMWANGSFAIIADGETLVFADSFITRDNAGLVKFHGGTTATKRGAVEVTDANVCGAVGGTCCNKDDPTFNEGGAVNTYGVEVSRSVKTGGAQPDFWAPGSLDQGLVASAQNGVGPHFLCDPSKNACVSARLGSVEPNPEPCTSSECNYDADHMDGACNGGACSGMFSCIAQVNNATGCNPLNGSTNYNKCTNQAKAGVQLCKKVWGDVAKVTGQSCPSSCSNASDVEWDTVLPYLEELGELSAGFAAMAAFDVFTGGLSGPAEVDVFAEAMANMTEDEINARIAAFPDDYARSLAAPGGQWFWVRPL